MTARVSMIVRHPIKAIGREELEAVDLAAGKWMPFDRLWGVAHERSKLDGGWGKKVNFLRGVTDPNLMAVTSKLDTKSKLLTLHHPEAGDVSFHPNRTDDEHLFLDWLRAIWPSDLPRPTGIYRASDAHLSDVPDPWISINSTSSLKSLSQRGDTDLSPHRWRGNIWVDGLKPWEEMNWVGKTIKIGEVEFAVRAQITRCKATMANPETGRRDADTLGFLDDLGHQEFGVYAEVINDGRVELGAPLTMLS